MGHVLQHGAFSLIYLFLYHLTQFSVNCSELDQLQVFHSKFMAHGTPFGLRDVDS